MRVCPPSRSSSLPAGLPAAGFLGLGPNWALVAPEHFTCSEQGRQGLAGDRPQLRLLGHELQSDRPWGTSEVPTPLELSLRRKAGVGPSRFPASLVSWLGEACVSCPKLGVLASNRSCEDPGLRSVGGGPAPHPLAPRPSCRPQRSPKPHAQDPCLCVFGGWQQGPSSDLFPAVTASLSVQNRPARPPSPALRTSCLSEWVSWNDRVGGSGGEIIPCSRRALDTGRASSPSVQGRSPWSGLWSQ